MLGLDDYRKSRFYQEARRDGFDEGKVEGKAEGKTEMLHENIRQMAANGCDAKQIAHLLGVDAKIVKKALKAPTP